MKLIQLNIEWNEETQQHEGVAGFQSEEAELILKLTPEAMREMLQFCPGIYNPVYNLGSQVSDALQEVGKDIAPANPPAPLAGFIDGSIPF